MNIVYISAGIALVLWIAGNLHRRKKSRNKVIRVVDNRCIRCRRCIKGCSRHVLEMVRDETESHVAVKDPDRCTACGDCIKKCRFNALELVERT
jgi:ferredoxin